MVVRRVPGRLPGLMLIVLSLTVSCRYLWWRYTATLNWDDPLSRCAACCCWWRKPTPGWCWCWAISDRLAA